MIALTQDRRQKRINWLKNRISSMEQCRDEMPFGLSEDESMELSAYKDSLASLTAQSVAWVFDDDLQDLKKGYIGNLAANNIEPPIDIPIHRLYTAPPVPEIKLPHELMDLVKAVEFYHSVKTENPDIEIGAWNDAYDWIKKAAVEAAPVIKRLNGLGK